MQTQGVVTGSIRDIWFKGVSTGPPPQTPPTHHKVFWLAEKGDKAPQPGGPQMAMNAYSALIIRGLFQISPCLLLGVKVVNSWYKPHPTRESGHGR